jgi:hypothetical protein
MSAASNSKYKPLTRHLRAQRQAQVSMSFAEIERVLGAKLPPSANAHRAWWSNNPQNNVMTRAWLEAGFQSEQVDIDGKRLVFSRRASQARAAPDEADVDKLSVFGCLRGTVVYNTDLTEPADPNWAKLIDDD